jgi:D-glycero-alpha-D-manno-heptose-7-phosphate kinase
MFFVVEATKKYNLIKLLNQQGGQVFNFHFTKDGTRGWKV